MANIHMSIPSEWWESEDYLGGITNEDEAKMIVPRIITEAERRGYEKAMKEVREAVIPTAATLTLANEETIDVYYIPKSFVLPELTPSKSNEV